jgi:hypothetical protein
MTKEIHSDDEDFTDAESVISRDEDVEPADLAEPEDEADEDADPADPEDEDAESALSSDEDEEAVPDTTSRTQMSREHHAEIDEYVVVPNEERRTAQIMSRAEYTEAISLRTEQIAAEGSQWCMLDEIPPNITTARELALAEMNARRCPLKVMRVIGHEVDPVSGITKKYVEIFSPNEMTHPSAQ